MKKVAEVLGISANNRVLVWSRLIIPDLLIQPSAIIASYNNLVQITSFPDITLRLCDVLCTRRYIIPCLDDTFPHIKFEIPGGRKNPLISDRDIDSTWCIS